MSPLSVEFPLGSSLFRRCVEHRVRRGVWCGGQRCRDMAKRPVRVFFLCLPVGDASPEVMASRPEMCPFRIIFRPDLL